MNFANHLIVHYTITQLKCTMNIEIKHVLSHINFHQVSREILKTEGEDPGFQHLQMNLVDVDAFKKTCLTVIVS